MRALVIIGALVFGSTVAVADDDGASAGDDTADELEELRDEQSFLAAQLARLRPLQRRLTGYVDIGFFSVGGDGSGIRTDVGHRYFPELDGVLPGSWVFMGDPLSTAVNARGEPANLGPSRALHHDSLSTTGGPTFAINSIGLELSAGVGDRVLLTTSFDLVPRNRDVGDPDGSFLGDFIEVKRAYAQYQVPISTPLLLIAGKFHSVIGREYGSNDAPDRLTVTPSLICRYTCGNPTGLKARAYLFDSKLSLTGAVTNGSHFVSSFAFSDEINRHRGMTGAARVAYEERLELAGEDALLVEVGVSGALGPQDGQPDTGVLQWQWAADLRAEWRKLVLTAQYVEGDVQGKTSAVGAPCDLAACLDFRGAAAVLGLYIRPWATPYVRVDWRDSLHRGGAEFVYISDVMRLTGGARFDIGTRLIAKLEYTHNRELGRIPQFSDDIFASALIVKY